MIRCHIRDTDILRRKVDIFVYNETEAFSDFYGGPNGTRRIWNTETINADNPEDTPCLRVPVEALPAILAELSKHLGAVEHPQQLRADYEHERKRVDKFLDAVIGIASEVK